MIPDPKWSNRDSELENGPRIYIDKYHLTLLASVNLTVLTSNRWAVVNTGVTPKTTLALIIIIVKIKI